MMLEQYIITRRAKINKKERKKKRTMRKKKGYLMEAHFF